jgi:hypothetical protein
VEQNPAHPRPIYRVKWNFTGLDSLSRSPDWNGVSSSAHRCKVQSQSAAGATLPSCSFARCEVDMKLYCVCRQQPGGLLEPQHRDTEVLINHWIVAYLTTMRQWHSPCWLFTAEIRVQSRLPSSEIRGWSGTRAGFFRVLLLSPANHHLTIAHTHLSSYQEMCDSPDQAAHYHTLDSNLGA